MTFARRVDSNHAEIKGTFESMGFSVLDLSRNGNGCPDLLVGTQEVNWLIEIKGKNGQRTEAQEKFAKNWKGPHCIIRSASGAVIVAAHMRDIRAKLCTTMK